MYNLLFNFTLPVDETGDTSDFDTCLKFVIKSKLESEGEMEVRAVVNDNLFAFSC